MRFVLLRLAFVVDVCLMQYMCCLATNFLSKHLAAYPQETINNTKLSGKAILGIENGGKPLSGRRRVRAPARLGASSPPVRLPGKDQCLFYRPTEGRRLSLPGWLVTYRNKVPYPGGFPPPLRLWTSMQYTTSKSRRFRRLDVFSPLIAFFLSSTTGKDGFGSLPPGILLPLYLFSGHLYFVIN